MKQCSQLLISTGMLPWGIDQWFFISSMMILMMLISNPISSSESMNCLRALTWKSRRPSHLHQINTISLFPVWATGKTSDSLRSRWVATSSRGPGLLCAPRDAPAELNLFHTERASAAWDTTLLEQLCTGLHQQLDDLDACLGQVMEEEDPALGRTGPTLAVKRYFQGIHVWKRMNTVTGAGKLSEWKSRGTFCVNCFLRKLRK